MVRSTTVAICTTHLELRDSILQRRRFFRLQDGSWRRLAELRDIPRSAYLKRLLHNRADAGRLSPPKGRLPTNLRPGVLPPAGKRYRPKCKHGVTLVSANCASFEDVSASAETAPWDILRKAQA